MGVEVNMERWGRGFKVKYAVWQLEVCTTCGTCWSFAARRGDSGHGVVGHLHHQQRLVSCVPFSCSCWKYYHFLFFLGGGGGVVRIYI